MARNAQHLNDLASGILVQSDRGLGLKNLLYAAPVPPPLKPLLMALVNGAHKERALLLDVAEEDGLLAALPANCQVRQTKTKPTLSDGDFVATPHTCP